MMDNLANASTHGVFFSPVLADQVMNAILASRASAYIVTILHGLHLPLRSTSRQSLINTMLQHCLGLSRAVCSSPCCAAPHVLRTLFVAPDDRTYQRSTFFRAWLHGPLTGLVYSCVRPTEEELIYLAHLAFESAPLHLTQKRWR